MECSIIWQVVWSYCYRRLQNLIVLTVISNTTPILPFVVCVWCHFTAPLPPEENKFKMHIVGAKSGFDFF